MSSPEKPTGKTGCGVAQSTGTCFGPVCMCVPLWVFSGYSAFLPQSKDMQVRLIGCLSLYVSPVTDWRSVQGVPHRSPKAMR